MVQTPNASQPGSGATRFASTSLGTMIPLAPELAEMKLCIRDACGSRETTSTAMAMAIGGSSARASESIPAVPRRAILCAATPINQRPPITAGHESPVTEYTSTMPPASRASGTQRPRPSFGP